MDFIDTISSLFKPDKEHGHPGAKWVYEQQGGCGARIYPNIAAAEKREVRNLFYEIQSCTIDRSTTDIGGSFTMTILATEAWDEIIEPDDYIRIFMGDQIVQTKLPSGAYNFASGALGVGKPEGGVTGGKVYVPIPGGKVEDRKQIKTLMMYERCLGKIDRVEKVTSPPADRQATLPLYTISGRFFGSIIQDISIYYNEWLPGLNALNVFYQNNINLMGPPNRFVKEILSVVLSAVPMPQWQLPKTLVKDLNYADIVSKNLSDVNKALSGFRQRLTEAQSSPAAAKIANSGSAVAQLQTLVSEIQAQPAAAPFSVLSIKGISECYGQTLNKSFLSNNSTSLIDLIKHLSNDVFNEFFVDMVPGGNPEGSTALDNRVVPTVMMRQRPYDLNSSMLTGLSDYGMRYAEKLSNFPRVNLGSSISSTLLDLKGQAVVVFGPLQESDFSKVVKGPAQQLISKIGADVHYSPNLLNYQVGRSGHDRLNAFLCLGSYNRGHYNQTDRVFVSHNGGFQMDIDSIRRYGFRMMEVSTQYAQPYDNKNQPKDIGQILKNFSQLLGNWYFMNPAFLNGRITSRFLPNSRLGIPCVYLETRKSPNNPVPKAELFYVQGVTDNFNYGQPITTTLTVIRGLRYNLESAASGKTTELISDLTPQTNNAVAFT